MFPFPVLNPISEELFPELSEDTMSGNSILENIYLSQLNPNFPGTVGYANKLLNRWTDVKGISVNPRTKGMFDGWNNNGTSFVGLNFISQDYRKTLSTYESPALSNLLVIGGKFTTKYNTVVTVHPLCKLSQKIDKIGELPEGQTVASMIGTIPDGFDNVGTALSATKSDITAKDLPKTSEDGQYVLSAKKSWRHNYIYLEKNGFNKVRTRIISVSIFPFYTPNRGILYDNFNNLL